MPEEPPLARRARIEELAFDYESQPKEDVVACNLCGQDDWVFIAHRDRYGYAATTTACRRCALTVLNPRMTSEAYGDFYRGVYRPLVSAYHGRLINAGTIKGEQKEYARHMSALLAPYVGNRGPLSLLDVGGSTGVVATTLAERFSIVPTVIDPAPEEIAEAEALGIETVPAFIEEWDAGDRTFDVVAMFQTIDHLLDVSLTFSKIRELLRPDGLFVFDIVDFRAAYLRNWSIEAATKIDHPYSLTELTAETFLKRTGFAVARKSYSLDHLHVVYLCRPAEPEADNLPNRDQLDRYFCEIRFVQNAPNTVLP